MAASLEDPTTPLLSPDRGNLVIRVRLHYAVRSFAEISNRKMQTQPYFDVNAKGAHCQSAIHLRNSKFYNSAF